MTTSGTNSLNPVRDTLVKAALRLVGAYASTDEPRPEQMVDALEAMNIMLKSWQVEGFLWLRKFALLTLVPGKATYQLGEGSTDVCLYTDTLTQVSRPTRISYATYRNASGFDREMTPLSRTQYMQLTNKTSAAPSTQYYYDPQLASGALTVWPVPVTADSLFITCDRGIFDMVNDTDTYDLPQEWLRVIKWGLAMEIAPEYAVPAGEMARLEARYVAIKAGVDSYDRETVPTQMEMA